MNDLFGISFSEKALHFVHIREGNLNAAEAIPYPIPIEISELFSEQSIGAMAEIIRNKKNENDLETVDLNIALPSKYAFLKKVAVPIDEEQDIVVEHMKWDLDTYLPDKLENYKVIRTEIEYDLNSYKEILVICISKTIIQKLLSLADKSETALKELLLDTFSLERFLKNHNYLSPSSNVAVFSLDALDIKTDFFINGKYYLTITEPYYGKSKDVPLEERIKDIAKQHLGKIESHISFAPFVKEDQVSLFVQGPGLNEEIFYSLQNAFSQELTRIPSPEQTVGILNNDNFNLYALGVVNHRISI